MILSAIHRPFMKLYYEASTKSLITELSLEVRILEIILQVEFIRLIGLKLDTSTAALFLAIRTM